MICNTFETIPNLLKFVKNLLKNDIKNKNNAHSFESDFRLYKNSIN